jgi:GNAT superfamily N-acetyltransferase
MIDRAAHGIFGTPTGVAIRAAVAADAEALFEIHKGSVRQLCKDAYSQTQLDAWFEGRASTIYRASIDAGRLWLAEEHGALVGFVGVKPGEVTFLFVAANAAGRGLGRRLFAFGLCEAARDFDGPLIVLATINAQRFYESFGFYVVGNSALSRGARAVAIEILKMQRPTISSKTEQEPG